MSLTKQINAKHQHKFKLHADPPSTESRSQAWNKQSEISKGNGRGISRSSFTPLAPPEPPAAPPKLPLDLRTFKVIGNLVTNLTLKGMIYFVSVHTRKGLIWTINWYPHMRSFVVAHTGGTISEEARLKRMAVCGACDALVSGKRAGQVYCGACKCGRRRDTDLRLKNRLTKWFCPRRLHDSAYPSWWGKQGCGGCGSQKADTSIGDSNG